MMKKTSQSRTKKLVILITLHKKMWEDQKRRRKEGKEKVVVAVVVVEQEKRRILTSPTSYNDTHGTHLSLHFFFFFKKICPHCTICRGTGSESNHVRDNKLTLQLGMGEEKREEIVKKETAKM
jgi:hypothetical protein